MGGVHSPINNAGGGGRKNPFKIFGDDIKRDFELSVSRIWVLSQLCVPHMKKAGYGSTIITTLMSSGNKSPHMSGYGCSKVAVNHIAANLAYDFGPDVCIHCVGSGAT